MMEVGNASACCGLCGPTGKLKLPETLGRRRNPSVKRLAEIGAVGSWLLARLFGRFMECDRLASGSASSVLLGLGMSFAE